MVRRIALLLASGSLMVAPGFGAPQINPAEKRIMASSPAVVLVSVKFAVTGRFHVGDEMISFGPVSIGGIGTGFIYRPDGYIITSGRLVDDANKKTGQESNALWERLRSVIIKGVVAPTFSQRRLQLTGTFNEISDTVKLQISYSDRAALSVFLANGTEYQAEIKQYSEAMEHGGKDVAIIKINGNDLPTVKLGDSEKVYVQEPINVMGYAGATPNADISLFSAAPRLEPTITNGHVSAVRTVWDQRVIQTDTVVGYGNNGGPAFNDANEVIGITTFRSAGGSGFTFLVPINSALEYANRAFAKPESGLFDKLWATALESYFAGNCKIAKATVQSVLNIMPKEPSAVRLMTAAETCFAEEGVVSRTLEGTSWVIYSVVAVLVLATGFLLLARKRLFPAVAVTGAHVGSGAAYSTVTSGAMQVESGAARGVPRAVAGPGFFISYRRDDTAPYAGRVYDHLSAHFGPQRLFMDIDTIRPGDDFVKVISDRVACCHILIALIGRQWLAITDSSGRRRLDDPNDYVRIEISSALARDVRVIPALVDGAQMPGAHELPDDLAPLARRNAIEISNTMFRQNMVRLIQVIEETTGAQPPPP